MAGFGVNGRGFQLLGKLIRLRRFQQLTSVAFGATSFPRKEANHQPLRGGKTSDRISGFTAVGILMTLPHNVISSGGKGTGFVGSRRRLRIQ